MYLYRVLISGFALWQVLRLMLRGDGAGLRARLGLTMPQTAGPHLWLHAASNGELTSARPVIAALRAARPDLALLITCNSDSGVALARQWGMEAHLAPFDLASVVQRVNRRWSVTAHITMESEIWPNRVLACPGPVLVLGARMSARSAKGWAKGGKLARRLLGAVAFASAQDPASRDRLRALGLPEQATGPVVDLKALYSPPDQTPDAAWQAAFPKDMTWLAASTHPGDDAVVIAAHLEARKHWPGLRLILAPRHPRRAAEVQALLQAAGLEHVLRTTGGLQAEVLLADTLGEMAHWYALAGVVFIGGTLSDRGGHTPYEPAAFGAALIHGPDVANFSTAFARLRAAGAAQEIRDGGELALALVTLRDPETRAAQAQKAQKALAQDTDLAGLMARILPHLPRG